MPFRPPTPVKGTIDRVVVGVREVEPAIQFFQSMMGGEIEEHPANALAGTCEMVIRWNGISMGFAETSGAASPLPTFLERFGEGMHHLVYSCVDPDDVLEAARRNDCQVSTVKLAGGAEVPMIGPGNSFGARMLVVEAVS
jgi:hypothetical protein